LKIFGMGAKQHKRANQRGQNSSCPKPDQKFCKAKRVSPLVYFRGSGPAIPFPISRATLFYLPLKLKAHALNWLEERVHESFAKYHSRVVFIDHLHYLFDLARARNASLEIGQVIRRLKTLAVNHGFLIFLLCHTTKGASENNLSYESIRDSSFVSQESDCVLMIKRTPEAGLNTARLRVEFHRRTGVMEKVIPLVKVNGLLQEQTLKEELGRRDWDN